MVPPDSGPLALVIVPTVDIKSRLAKLGSLSWEVEIKKTLISFKLGFKMGIHKKQAEGKNNLS